MKLPGANISQCFYTVTFNLTITFTHSSRRSCVTIIFILTCSFHIFYCNYLIACIIFIYLLFIHLLQWLFWYNYSIIFCFIYFASIIMLPLVCYHNRKYQNLSNSNSSRDFWHLANNISNNLTSLSFPPLLQPDDATTVSSFSSLKHLLPTLFWMILGIFLLLHPLTILSPK